MDLRPQPWLEGTFEAVSHNYPFRHTRALEEWALSMLKITRKHCRARPIHQYVI